MTQSSCAPSFQYPFAVFVTAVRVGAQAVAAARLAALEYKSSLGQGISRAASTPPFDKLPFLGTGPSYRSMGTSIDSAIGKVRHGITLRKPTLVRRRVESLISFPGLSILLWGLNAGLWLETETFPVKALAFSLVARQWFRRGFLPREKLGTSSIGSKLGVDGLGDSRLCSIEAEEKERSSSLKLKEDHLSSLLGSTAKIPLKYDLGLEPRGLGTD
ncbi:hypothetical protein VNO78_35283 [Psophocarpus tetragonolobus]|uniref:Uncharacterized protein n=1 Tax=Psophocarpus tetragonolobus TaxID=3891 RepID=A0AAN9NS26_PSOTE